MEPEDYIKNGKVFVWRKPFAIVKSRKPYEDAFANITDKKETTVIIEQTKLNQEDIIEIDKDWRILTFDMVLPFELVGFLAKISGALTESGIPIFVISVYSTDHVLIKQKDLEKAKKKLEKLGLEIIQK